MGPLKVWRAIHRFFYGIPDDEEALCMYCGAPIAPHEGCRDGRGATCDEECTRLYTERLA